VPPGTTSAAAVRACRRTGRVPYPEPSCAVWRPAHRGPGRPSGAAPPGGPHTSGYTL